jgi:hypothetical protein
MRTLLDKLAPVLAAGASLALEVPASALTFLGASGSFQNPVGGAGVSFESSGGPYLDPQPAAPTGNQTAPNGIRWGNPVGPNRSGLRIYGSDYGPTGVNIPTDGTPSTVANVLTLDHINFPIFGGSAISSVELTLTYSFLDDDNNPFSVNDIVPITVEETPNSPPCPFPSPPGNPCSDRITLVQPQTLVYYIDNGPEFIELSLNFPTSGTNFIITDEGQQNPFSINATFVRVPAPVAFGAIGPMALFAANFRRLRKRYAPPSSESD